MVYTNKKIIMVCCTQLKKMVASQRNRINSIYPTGRLHLNTKETVITIEAKIKALENLQRSKRESSNLPSNAELKTRVAEALAKLEQHDQNVDFIHTNHRELICSRKERKERYKGMEHCLKKLVKATFVRLSARFGEEFGHVQTRGNEFKIKYDNKDLQQLSGGERSTAQLNLLLSMMSCVDFPFCIMDEFDICMDERRRSLSLHQLIHAAESTDGQFIFVTPHSIEALGSDVLNKDYIGKFTV